MKIVSIQQPERVETSKAEAEAEAEAKAKVEAKAKKGYKPRQWQVIR